MERGDLCFVKHHYGHTRTTDQMTILKIDLDPRFNSGTKVFVDGLDWPVDSNLIVLKPRDLYKIRFRRSKHHELETAFVDGYCNYDARERFRKAYSPDFYI